jgi:hypothetical protein
MAAVGVAEVGAERSDFDFKGILSDEDNAEMRADVERLGKKPQNLLRRGVGGDVEIRGLPVEKDVADAAANEEGVVAVVLESVADRIGEVAGIHGTIMRQKGGSKEAKKQRSKEKQERDLLQGTTEMQRAQRSEE